MLHRYAKSLGYGLALVLLIGTSAEASSQIAASKEEWCKSQLQALIKQQRWGFKAGDSYRSHFNTNLHRCFVTVEAHQGAATSKVLLDAYAQQTFASYFEMKNMPILTICVLLPNTKEEKKCNSDSDYESFVAQYMQRKP